MMFLGLADGEGSAVLFPTELTQKLVELRPGGGFQGPTGSMAEGREHGLLHQTDVDLSPTFFTY